MFFLKGLGADHRKLLREQLSGVIMVQGKTIFSHGEVADLMFFVELGTVRLVKESSVGGHWVKETISVIKPGEFFGEEAVLGEKNVYQFSAEALETGILHSLSRDDIETIMAKSVGAATKILLEISSSYRAVLDDSAKKGNLILFYGPRDGGGGTTVAVNTAIRLAEKTGKPVAFLDADFQLGNAALITGSPPIPNISQLIRLENQLNMEAIRKYMHWLYEVDFLWGPEMPQDSEIINRNALQKIVRELCETYAFVVVESKCFIDEQTLYLWDEADRFCLMGTPDLGFLERTMRLQRLFRSFDYNLNRFFGVMAKSTPETEKFAVEFEKVLQRPVISIRSKGDIFHQAEMAGQPIAIYSPNCEYIKGVDILINALLDKKVETQKEGGIFSRLAAFFA